ncbi:unnamed protein product [Thlaspi arvense]|uniref:F-box associated beta-propeller type 1 domain-containing protein n=1 Tax=Thlaspi arvense TaxID=13288 RepID=A0AAU9T917_THLAR|nr:unnamed protein product [Thlaspi arvense]
MSACNALDVINFSLSVSVVRGEKLYVLLERGCIDSLEMKIWVIDEAKDTNIQYFLDVDFGNITLTGMSTVESFLVDEENKRVVCCRRDKKNRERTIFYIVGGKHNISVRRQALGEIARESYDYWPLLVSYVPSLIQIQQGEANVKGVFSSI